MLKHAGTRWARTVTTSVDSSKNESMTPQSQQELDKLLLVVNKMIVETALKSVLGHEFASRQFRRQLMRKQVKHTTRMLRNLSDSEKLLLLDELKLTTESTGNETP